MFKHATLGLAASFALTLSSPLAAAPEGNVSYDIVRGDTLIGLSNDYFSNRSAVTAVQRLNGIANPRLIPVGKTIQIPRRYLKYRPADLEVRSLSGPVYLNRNGKEVRMRKGVKVVEGDIIRTERKGFVSIAGYGSSRLSMPSNSRVKIIDARRYLINDLIDVQVKVLKGRSSVVAPKLKTQERYRVGTPVAVTAVRGTQFRIGYEPDDDLGLTEVVEGDVLVGNGTRDVPAIEGFGVTASSAGVSDTEALLPSPTFVTPGKTQTASNLTFSVKPMDNVKGYRTQISNDASFLNIVDEVVSEGTDAVFESLDDGTYVVRSRAIAQSGLEGKSDIYQFRRKRLGISATAEKSQLLNALKFAWQTTGSGTSFTSFQLWEKGKRDTLIVDETGLTQDDLHLSDLSPGTYGWRVATFQIVGDEPIKVWGPVQELNVTE